ncbi:MAG: T9SS type A sorting domain-containing protein [Marinilabiliaceae bacterium]|jgi:hypothetical protein|nr:T9SS type A sorting domain-containing protein [Marinilabiliaceae bacterium]
MYKYLLLLVFLSFDFYSKGQYYRLSQADTIVVYNVRNQTIEMIPPVLFDITHSFDSTPSSIGAMGKKIRLDVVPPENNLVDGTRFTYMERAEINFDVSSYPVRTAVRLKAWVNDTLKNRCSGTMVADNLVLTAAHCLWGEKAWTLDSLLVAPAFDNGEYQLEIASSLVDKYYIFKSYYDSEFHDIALLELRKPIGFKTGWQGIAFNTDTTFYTQNVFHKLSYPSIRSPFDSTLIFNGDTLYYNYGLIDYFGNNWNLPYIGVKNGSELGIPGISGSSLFYTNNVDYYVHGVANFSRNLNHYLIGRNVFYQLRNIIDNYAMYVNEQIDESNPLILYPNPASINITVEFHCADNNHYTLGVYNMQGQLVKVVENITDPYFSFERNNLPSGVYLFQIFDKSGGVNYVKKVLFI